MLEKVSGTAHRVGDDINTDYIIPGKYLMDATDEEELASHALEGVDEEFSQRLSEGDLVVAGKNFGCGSSREEAPIVLQKAGVGGVLAKSFARIFYRNAINVSLPILECDTEDIEQGDEIEMDLQDGTTRIANKNKIIKGSELPQFITEVVQLGGLIPYLKEQRGFPETRSSSDG